MSIGGLVDLGHSIQSKNVEAQDSHEARVANAFRVHMNNLKQYVQKETCEIACESELLGTRPRPS